MSHVASGGGVKGNARDRKGKGKMVDISPPSSDSETEQGRKTTRSAFDSMASLEAALPINYYDGKSKSFGNLSELGFEDAKDMLKKEHPINKRPRLLMAHKILLEKMNSTVTQSSSITPFPFDDHKNGDDEDDHNKNQEEDGKCI